MIEQVRLDQLILLRDDLSLMSYNTHTISTREVAGTCIMSAPCCYRVYAEGTPRTVVTVTQSSSSPPEITPLRQSEQS